MRLFIGVELPGEVRNALSREAARLASSGADVRWTPPQNSHVTLKFLGEAEASDAQAVGNVLSEISAGMKKFAVSLSGSGAFPDLKHPLIV